MPDQNQLTKKAIREAKYQEKLARRQSADQRAKIGRNITWAVVIVVAVAVIVGVLYAAGLFQSKTPVTLDPVSAVDHIKGSSTAPAVLIEYSDFQCPYCQGIEPSVEQLEKDFGTKLAVVYRYFPLSGHPQSNIAAQAAEAAGLQGKFWEMHDLLFEHQSDWSGSSTATDTFKQYAADLKLDITKFESDSNSQAVKDRIAVDLASGNKARIQGTPTFFLNGKNFALSTTFDKTYQNLKQAITNIVSSTNTNQ
jgi:protein-disulfide isomerase